MTTDSDRARWAEDMRKAKIEAALAAVGRTTPGNWWVDGRGDLFPDPVGTFRLGRDIGGSTPLWGDSNRLVIAACRELAEEVLSLRSQLEYARSRTEDI